MAINMPPKPVGSAIEEIPTFEGVTFRWRHPDRRLARLGTAAFLAFWLCGWAAGEVFVGWVLLSGAWEIPWRETPWPLALFMIGWLGGWTVGGAFAIRALVYQLRGAGHESVALGQRTFRHEPGYGFEHPEDPYRRMWTWNGLLRGKPRRPVEAQAEELGPVTLDRVGERQRLYVDRGAARIEIGAGLSEPEREWLAEVLARWQSS